MSATNQNHVIEDSMTSNYKEYSLEQLENWIHDSVLCSEATPREIYDCIYNAVLENYLYFKKQAEQSEQLMELLSVNATPTKKSWVVEIEGDGVTGEYYLTIPYEIIQQNGWKTGDLLKWIDNGDGSFTLVKSNET